MTGGRGRGSGYSLMELMVVIAIVGIMTGLGIGSFVYYGRGRELSEATTVVTTVLSAARQAAITRGLERRVAIDLRNEQLWLEGKIDEGRGRAWTNNSRRLGEIITLPRFVDIADVNCALGLLHSDNNSIFPANQPAAIFYVVFNAAGNVTEISAGGRVEASQTSFSLHLALKSDPLQLGGRNVPYDYALISSGQLRNIRGRVGVGVTDKDAAEMQTRRKVHTITVLGNTGRIKTYPYGKNSPWHDELPIGVYR